MRGHYTDRTGCPYKSRSRDPVFTAWTPSSFDDTMGERNHFTEQQITWSDRSSHKIWHACRENSFAFKSHFISTAAPLSMLLKNINHKRRFLFTPMQNSRLIWPVIECFGVKGKIWPLGKPTPNAHNHGLFYCFDLFIIWRSNGWLQWKDHPCFS